MSPNPTREEISSPDAPVPLPIFSQGMKLGNLIFVSGNIGQDPASGGVIEGSVYDRTVRALRNIEIVLKEGGGGLDKVVKANVYLTDMANFASMNKAYAEIMPKPMPARTCVCVKELPLKTDVEIECIGYI